MRQTTIKIYRGDIFWVNFEPSHETEIKKTRPAIVLSSDIINEKSTRVLMAPITSNVKNIYFFEYRLRDNEVVGKVMIDQMRAIDKSRLGSKISSLSFDEMKEVDEVIKLTLSLK